MTDPTSETPTRRTFSRLLAEIAALPHRELRAAWARGFRPGDVFAERYELVEPLGRGGFGVVYRAQDRRLHRFVAFKAIPPGGQTDESIQREADVAAQLEHAHLVRLYDSGRCDSGAYLIFELLKGETLAGRLRRGPVPVREAVRIALEVTRALEHAHAQGVLHRDLKPSNVFLTDDGHAKVLDFGLAYYFGQGVARAGTPGYMAPEQARGGPEDARTDVFAVGVVLREMIAGARDGEVRAPVAGLIARATDPDPARRPPDAGRLAEELEEVGRRLDAARKRTRRISTVVGLVLAGAVAGWVWAKLVEHGEPRPVVAVADLENATGEPGLDELGNLLRTSLEQMPSLSVLPRHRLASLVQAGGEPPTRLDCALATLAGQRADARAVLCGEVSRTASGYAIRVQATDPVSHQPLGTPLADVAPTQEAVLAVLDRLAERARRVVAPAFPEPPPVKPVGSVTTSSMEAYRHYLLGEQCVDRPAHGQDCSVELRQALALDPGFALAAYELAIWASWNGRPLSEQRSLVEEARRLSGRAPEKERLLVDAWWQHLEGNDSEALELLGKVSEGWPQDRHAFYQAGDILRHRDELARAVPEFEAALALDPGFPWAAGALAQSLGALGRFDELRAWAGRWEAQPGPGPLHGLSLARGWLGDFDGAREAAREALELGGGVSAQEDRLQAELFAGNYEAVRQGAAALAGPGSPVRRLGYYGLAGIEAYEGRPTAGLAHLDRLARELPAVEQDAVYHTIRADYLIGSGDAAAVWAEVDAARRLDPRLAAEHAVSLAYLGDLEHAAILARDLPPGGALDRTYRALVRVRGGGNAGAVDELCRVSEATPVFAWRVAPLFLCGEALAAAGRDEEAVRTLEKAQAQYVPLSMWRAWAHPRGLYLLARSQERLGRTREAKGTVDRLLLAWANAEPDAPLLAEARALQARVAAVSGPAAPAGAAASRR